MLFGAGLLASRLVDGAWPSYSQLATTDNLPNVGLPLVLIVHVLTFGIGEETGWRGFALPRLQSRADRVALNAHPGCFLGRLARPLLFENDSMMSMGPVQVFGRAAGLWMGAVFLTWLLTAAPAACW